MRAGEKQGSSKGPAPGRCINGFVMPTAAQMAATSHAPSAPHWWVPRTCAIGLAYFSGQLGADLYYAYLPIFYQALVASNLLIRLVMSIDNIASLTLQQYYTGL